MATLQHMEEASLHVAQMEASSERSMLTDNDRHQSEARVAEAIGPGKRTA